MGTCLSDESEGRLLPILGEDDTESFIELMLNDPELRAHQSTVLEYCFLEKAKKCALVLMNGQIRGYPEPDFLFTALGSLCDPQLILLLLQKYDGSYLANESRFGILPIHFAIADLPSDEWSVGESLIKLLILACHPSKKQRRESARLVAEYTKDINRVALGLIQQGDIKELAALLLVAHHQVFQPFSTGETIMDHIDVDDMVSRAINGQSAPSASAAGLLQIFDKAGYALSQYYKSMEENVPFEDVILQVAGLLKEAGFQVTRNDVDVSNSFSLRLDVLDHIHEKLGITTDPSKECVAHSVHRMLGSELPVLCFDEKMDSCLPEGWEGRLLPILAEDDKDRFIDFMVNEKEVDSSMHSKVLQHCFYEQAKKCALVMINGELPGFANPVDCGSTTLFNAVRHLCDPEVIRVLLQNCKGSYLANQTVLHYLPIHIVLAEIMAAEPLSKWSIGESVIKLLILVCHPKTKPRVECARLIAEYTNDANKVALGLLQRGDIRQLAALLLVAHHKVFEPLSTGETIMDHTDFNDMILPSINGQFAASASAAGLLRIFDKAGDALSQFYKQMKEDVRGEDVVVEVAYLIKKVVFHCLKWLCSYPNITSFACVPIVFVLT